MVAAATVPPLKVPAKLVPFSSAQPPISEFASVSVPNSIRPVPGRKSTMAPAERTADTALSSRNVPPLVSEITPAPAIAFMEPPTSKVPAVNA